MKDGPIAVLRSNAGALSTMTAAVILQVTGAIVLKTLADHRESWGTSLILWGIAGVVVLNLLRLLIWGIAHRRYPLSKVFPISSLFFPAMLVVSASFGESVQMRQVLGALLITLGTLWLAIRVKD